MICVQIDQNGYLSVINPQPVDISQCAYVLGSAGDFSPFALSTQQGAEIAVSIGTLWAFAFVCRLFVRQILYSR